MISARYAYVALCIIYVFNCLKELKCGLRVGVMSWCDKRYDYREMRKKQARLF